MDRDQQYMDRTKVAYDLLTQQVGFPPEDIVFDPNVLTVATGITSLGFTYQDSAGVTTATAADIRTIVLTLTAQPRVQPAATPQGRALVTMTDSVRLRNR